MTGVESMGLSSRRDLRVIERMARQAGPDAWPADISEMALYMVGRIRDLEAESHARKLTIDRLVAGSTESQERAL